MRKCTVICERCGKQVHGLIAMENTSDEMTAGFYNVSWGYWSDFRRGKEKWVCDACMQKDPRYKEMYYVQSNRT